MPALELRKRAASSSLRSQGSELWPGISWGLRGPGVSRPLGWCLDPRPLLSVLVTFIAVFGADLVNSQAAEHHPHARS